jgi:hypothetical protein
MNNNTETIEYAAEQYAKQFDFAEDSSPCGDFTAGANWQKEQDEAKYKALLDSHNELLQALIESSVSVWGYKELINKAKTITNEN